MGPSIADELTFRNLLQFPISHVRFNMSHGTKDEHLARLHMVRKVSKECNKDLILFADLCGPKIRVQTIEHGELSLSHGDVFRIAPSSVIGNKERISLSFHELYTCVTKGTNITFNDGKIEVVVIEIDHKDIVCSVIKGGILVAEKGVNIPTITTPLPALTEKDKEDVLFAIENTFDALGLSFVSSEKDIHTLQLFLEEHGTTLPIISKIETRKALTNIEQIIRASDSIMVARGDLGIEIPVLEIPIVQKELCYLGKKMNTPVIVATEILKTMTENTYPTRAEVTDAMNALIDGASYLMLSDETTVGLHPTEAVELLSGAIDEFTTHHTKYSLFEKK
jgi:pyruvate kinase